MGKNEEPDMTSSELKRVNYHTHCRRCRHARGEASEYAEEAIRKGLSVLGFSDHLPFPFDRYGGMRMPYAELEEYLEERLGTMELQPRESIVCGEGIEFVIYQLSEREVSFGEAAKSYGGCLEAYEEDTGFGRESMYKGSAGDVIGDRFDAGVLGGPLYPRISHESYGRQHYHRTGFPGA